MELEAQLTYATALMAGCLWIVWEIADFSRQTGWDGLMSLFLALGAMTVLEIVVLGMGAFIFYRGHWMAVAMVEEREGPPVEEEAPGEDSAGPAEETEEPEGRMSRLGRLLRSTLSRRIMRVGEGKGIHEAEELDRICTNLFYRSFRFLHHGLMGLLLFLCLRLATDGELTVVGPFCALLFVYLASGFTLRLLARLLFFLPVIRRASANWDALRERLHRSLGIWQLGGRRGHVPPNRLLSLTVFVLFVLLGTANLVWVSDCELAPDRRAYLRGRDERVVFDFRLGGVRNDRYVDTFFELTVNGRRRPSKGKWFPAGTNSYACSLPLDEIRNGPCHARLRFKGWTTKGMGMKGATSVVAETRFVVLE